MKCQTVLQKMSGGEKPRRLQADCGQQNDATVRVRHVSAAKYQPSWPSCGECAAKLQLAHLREFTTQPLESENTVPYEKVNHPKHYNSHPAGIECVDVIEHFSLNIGTAIKYAWRAGLKPGEATIEDLKKASWYINREIERLTRDGGKK